jgi:hypothetical protein
MKFLRFAPFVIAVAPLLAPAANAASTSAPAESPRPKSSGFVFSLLPKSLQRNPRLDFNIMTEMTPEGRKAKQPTVQAPIYFVAQAGAMHNTGVGTEGNLKAPPPERLQQLLVRALAERGYLESTQPAERPGLAIVFNWGASTFNPPTSVADAAPAPSGDDSEAPPADTGSTGDVPVPEIVLRRALLERALLLGGAKFAKEIADAMEEVDRNARVEAGVAAVISPDFGGGSGMTQDPFDRLRQRSPEMDRLIDELFSSSFFVIASAYDYDALAKGQRRLLWRTKMTVNSLGVNMVESIPPLIASAAPFLGRETPDPVVVTKRITRGGDVQIGTPVVVPDAPASPPASAPKKGR